MLKRIRLWWLRREHRKAERAWRACINAVASALNSRTAYGGEPWSRNWAKFDLMKREYEMMAVAYHEDTTKLKAQIEALEGS